MIWHPKKSPLDKLNFSYHLRPPPLVVLFLSCVLVNRLFIISFLQKHPHLLFVYQLLYPQSLIIYKKSSNTKIELLEIQCVPRTDFRYLNIHFISKLISAHTWVITFCTWNLIWIIDHAIRSLQATSLFQGLCASFIYAFSKYQFDGIVT